MQFTAGEITTRIQEEFKAWWQKEKIVSIPLRVDTHVKDWLDNSTGVINASTHTKGTYSHCWTDYHQPDGTIVAIKSPLGSTLDKRCQLYQEYKIHCAVYNRYIEEGIEPRVIKPLWIKKIAFNNGVASPSFCIGFERIDCTIYEKLVEQKGDNDTTRRWKKEIVDELSRVGKEWGFFHRDCHLMNMAVVNNDWKFFDLGMSIAFGMDQYQNANPFYDWGLVPVKTHDQRILLFSWDGFGDKDNWVTQERKRLEKVPKRFWKRDMPVVVSGHPTATTGVFEYIDTATGGIVVEIWVPTSTKIITIKSKIRPPSTYETTEGGHSLTCIFRAEDVRPDTSAEHNHYYFPTYT
jgi:hypothetical protein